MLGDGDPGAAVLELGQQRGGWTRRGGGGVVVVDLDVGAAQGHRRDGSRQVPGVRRGRGRREGARGRRGALQSNAAKAEEAERRWDGFCDGAVVEVERETGRGTGEARLEREREIETGLGTGTGAAGWVGWRGG